MGQKSRQILLKVTVASVRPTFEEYQEGVKMREAFLS
jgi:hypothetical protein